jgi:Family of unknown function (DUF6788)
VIKQSRRRDRLIRALAGLAPSVIQGSLVKLEGSCGKPSCVCARDRNRQHVRHYLSWNEAGRTHMLYIPQARLKDFRRGTQAWSEFKRRAQQLARLNAQILKSQELEGS